MYVAVEIEEEWLDIREQRLAYETEEPSSLGRLMPGGSTHEQQKCQTCSI